MLTCKVTEFDTARVRNIFRRVIDLRSGLDQLPVRRREIRELDHNTPIGKLTVTVSVKAVDGPCIDKMIITDVFRKLLEVFRRLNFDVRMREHPRKKCFVPFQRDALQRIEVVALFAIHPDRNPGADRSVKMRGIDSPLLARVATEKPFIKIAPDLRHYEGLGGSQVVVAF